jgi:Open reading frame 2 N-terminal domain
MMRRIRYFLLAGGVTCAAVWSLHSAFAQSAPAGFLAGKATRTADYSSFAQGTQISSKGQTYVLLPGVRAVAADPESEPAGLDVVERKGHFVLYRENGPAAQSARAMTLQSSTGTGTPITSQSVVLNPRTGKAGVVLGTIAVKLADMTQAGAIAESNGLTVDSQFARLNLVFFKVAPGQDIVAATAALRADPRVTSADPEILENPKVPY